MMEGMVESKLPDILQYFTRYGNSFGQSDRLRGKWTEDLEFKLKDARKEYVEYLWFVGDYASYDSRAIEVSKKVAGILNGSGIDFGIMYDGERNAGNEVKRMGEVGLFEMLAEHNLENLNKAKFDRVFTTDPHTYHTLKNDYPNQPAYDRDLSVTHYIVLLSELIDNGKLKVERKVDKKATYHDPCYLGRFNSVYEEPRKILESLVHEFVELPRNREDSYCCGAGGGKIWMEDVPGVEERPSENRIKEALEVGAEYFVVSCPKDYVMFQDAVKTLSCEDKIKVMDIAQLLARTE
jgi:Fe-S oxidoreductase